MDSITKRTMMPLYIIGPMIVAVIGGASWMTTLHLTAHANSEMLSKTVKKTETLTQTTQEINVSLATIQAQLAFLVKQEEARARLERAKALNSSNTN